MVASPHSVAVPRAIEEARRERRLTLSRQPNAAPELKFYTAVNTMGVLSQNTWGAVVGSNGVWGSIAQGTDQNQRLGRRIRVKRYRVVFAPSALAYDTDIAAVTLMRTDSNIAASDLFVTSGSARSQFDAPNPVGQSAVFEHTVATAMQFCGSAAGTTPSYAAPIIVHDVKFERGRVVSYDASGATGPTILSYFNCSETSITLDYGVQVWFEDA